MAMTSQGFGDPGPWHIYDVASVTYLGEIPFDPQEISWAFSPNGSRVLTSGNGHVRLWHQARSAHWWLRVEPCLLLLSVVALLWSLRRDRKVLAARPNVA
jgi:hypothetical protein